MSQLEFLPIPQSHDFDNAFERIDEAIRSHGGAESVARGEAAISVADNLAYHQDLALANYSTLFIPYESDREDPESYTPAHAFSQGYMMAKPVNDLLYQDRYEFADYYESLNGWMGAHRTETIEDERRWFEANSYLVEKYSEGGLQRVGDATKQIIERWGSSLFVDSAMSRIFRLGCGALVMSGVIHQRSVNEYVLNSESFSQNLDSDLEALLAGGHGDEDRS